MEQLAVQLGAFGALVVVLVGLVVALRTGTLVTGRELERAAAAAAAELQRQADAHAAQLQREQALHDESIADARTEAKEWRDAHAATAESLRTALDANELLAQQADRLVSGTELTQRLIEAMRQKVGP